MRSNRILFLVNLNMRTVNDNGYGELVSFVCNQGRIKGWAEGGPATPLF